MKRPRHRHLWVLRSRERGRDLWCNPTWRYFAKRTSLKNPRYLDDWHCKMKYFSTRDQALDYYMAKCQILGQLKPCDAVRIKIWVDGNGYYDWFKNSRANDRRNRR